MTSFSKEPHELGNRGCVGQVVRMFAFPSDRPSSNHAEVHNLSRKNCIWKEWKETKEVGVGQFFKNRQKRIHINISFQRKLFHLKLIFCTWHLFESSQKTLSSIEIKASYVAIASSGNKNNIYFKRTHSSKRGSLWLK